MDPLRKKVGYAGRYILFVLYKHGSLHGYEAQQAVPDLTGGSVELSMASVYSTLGRLLDLDLVELIDEGQSVSSSKGPPRKVYQLTGEGRRVVAVELENTRALLRDLEGPTSGPAGVPS